MLAAEAAMSDNQFMPCSPIGADIVPGGIASLNENDKNE
jgi:hypothetical protein